MADRKGGPLRLRIPVGAGVFHQNARGNALFVATDVAKGFNMIEFVPGVQGGTAFSNRRFELPARFSFGKPHDIVATGSTAFPTAHNLAFSEGAFFVTHSGARSSRVSVLELDAAAGVLNVVSAFETGLNPFGISALSF